MKRNHISLVLAALLLTPAFCCCSSDSEDLSSYRPYVRWWWNGDRIESEELVRELHVMKDAGIGGVEISPISFPSGADSVGRRALTWLGDEWLECLKTVFDEMKKLGMGCDLLVGSGWPFGSESLPMEDRASIMIATAEPVTGGHRHVFKQEDMIAKADPAVTIINEERKSEIVKLLLVPDPINSLDEAIDVTDRMKDGVLTLDVPAGDYQLHALIRFDSFASVINGAPGAAGSQIDYMNAGAIRRYLDHMADVIEEKTGPLSDNIRALFVDNMELEGCNWTSDFAEEFQRRRGYDVMPWFPFILFKMGRLGDVSNYKFGGGRGEEFEDLVQRARYDFEITRMELMYERYTVTFHEWCKERGVKARAQAYGRGFWPLDSSLDYDIPEGESWTTNWLRHRIGEEMGDTDYRRGRAYTMVNKYVSSAAHIAGKRLVSAEEMTNTYLVFTTSLEFVKVGSDMSAFSGVTHSVWHGFNYSPPDAPFPGWVQYGTFHSERNTWWPYAKLLNDYRARMSSVLQNVDMVTPIAILPANGDLWSELGAQNEPFPVKINNQWTSILWEAVHKNGGGGDYLSEGVIADATVKDGKLKCRTREYGVLFLAGLKGIDETVLAKIDRFVRDGGRVFCVGTYPFKSLGMKDHEKRDEAIKKTVESLAKDCPDRFVLLDEADGGWLEWYTKVMQEYDLPHDVTITVPDRFLLQNHYKADDGTDWFLFANSSLKDRKVTDLVFDHKLIRGKRAGIFNPDDGKTYSLKMNGDTLHLELGPSETVLVRFARRKSAETEWNILPFPGDKALHPDNWMVTMVNPEVDSTITFACDTLPDLKDRFPSFMGTATYSGTVKVPEGSSPTCLHLGEVHEVAEVRINGKEAGLRWWGDPVFDVTGLLNPGENIIEVKVTTLMCNYMRSLEGNSAAERFVFRRSLPAVPSGLLGPVSIY